MKCKINRKSEVKRHIFCPYNLVKVFTQVVIKAILINAKLFIRKNEKKSS